MLKHESVILLIVLSLVNLADSTETTPAPQFNRQFTLKLMTEDCNLLKVMRELFVIFVE